MERYRPLRPLAALLLTLAVCAGLGPAAAAEENDPWPDLVRDVFNGRDLADGAAVIAIEMPSRAEDAAVVPVTLRTMLPPGDARTVKAITLVIDQNPAPVAATFKPGPGVTMVATRVRVDSYTNVHAVAELSDGRLYATTVYVKASGGCSAPTAKNAEEAKAGLGQMRFRQFAAAAGSQGRADGPASVPREAQVMIRHPNSSGLQRDQVTLLYIPAFFVREIRIWQGDEPVLAVDGGISLSEDPNIRFNYRPNGAARFRVEAVDSDGHTYTSEWPVEAM
ncbi:MAG: quinoprotein dehydrogenase-associated SoxYZ-like carrier [Bradyrhizobiaceae bacterium]|nr:quinoprotein dehydrogenase-associated SoxYZ-like carrier [Bradyrhizobiaceae bacterium]